MAQDVRSDNAVIHFAFLTAASRLRRSVRDVMANRTRRTARTVKHLRIHLLRWSCVCARSRCATRVSRRAIGLEMVSSSALRRTFAAAVLNGVRR